MQKITPFLWFDHNADKAVNHYLSIFKNLRIDKVVRCGDAGPGPNGSVPTIAFQHGFFSGLLGHGTGQDQVRREMKSAGYRLATNYNLIASQHF